MDYQRIFENVAIHLLRQNARAERESWDGGICTYRAPDGKRCGIGGGCMPDRFYRPGFEGRRIDRVLMDEITGASPEYLEWLGFTNEPGELKFMVELQRVHDNSDPLDWRERLVVFARDYSLHWPAYL